MLNAMDSLGTKETTWQRKPLSAQPSPWKRKTGRVYREFLTANAGN